MTFQELNKILKGKVSKEEKYFRCFIAHVIDNEGIHTLYNTKKFCEYLIIIGEKDGGEMFPPPCGSAMLIYLYSNTFLVCFVFRVEHWHTKYWQDIAQGGIRANHGRLAKKEAVQPNGVPNKDVATAVR